MMPGEVRAFHSWQLRGTVVEVNCMADVAAWFEITSTPESTSTSTHPDLYPIVRKLSFGGRSGGTLASWKQKSGHRRVFLLPRLITGSKYTDMREMSRPGARSHPPNLGGATISLTTCFNYLLVIAQSQISHRQTCHYQRRMQSRSTWSRYHVHHVAESKPKAASILYRPS